jgi:predicted nucleic acid-binding protein
MSGKFFLDTNIFVYSFDHDHSEKRKRSLELIAEALETGYGMISTQVVQEFLNVATRKFAVPLRNEDAHAYLRTVLNPLCRVYPDVELFEMALDTRQISGYSIYDSLIIAAARRGGCSTLLSEDLHSGQQIAGLTIVNPYTSPL